MVATSPVLRAALPVALLTGFDAFGGDVLNPSALATRALDGREFAGHRVVAAQLPTVFGQSREVLQRLIQDLQPALVLGVGQAGGRVAVSLERVAINVDDARIADNAGTQPVDQPVVVGGPAAYFTNLPIKAMLAALQRARIPAQVSQTAGTFVCNHVFYGLMHGIATGQAPGGMRGGFVHVPWLPSQGSPSLPLDVIVQGLEVALTCALSTHDDIALSAGALN